MTESGHHGNTPTSRRGFLALSAAGAALGIVALNGKSARADILDTLNRLLDLDAIVLNYAYEMEELQSDFFSRVSRSPVYNQLEARERSAFDFIARQDREHFEALGQVRRRQGARANGFNEPNGLALKQERRYSYPTGTFTKRETLLRTAVDIKESCVAAYHGAADLLKNDALLTPAVAIAGVDGRHLVVLREIAGLDPVPTSFENQTSPQIIGQRLAKYGFNGGGNFQGATR